MTWLEQYFKHSALNLGQAARDLRYFYFHPNADKLNSKSRAFHYFYSFLLRTRSFGKNIFYSVIPPHFHHKREDLEYMLPASESEWFLHGYAPWAYPDPITKEIIK